MTYATAAPIYRAAGWVGVLPLPSGRKSPPPDGYTGETGAWPSDDDIAEWVTKKADGNLGLRLPDGVVGIDVDQYGNKSGAQTLADAEAKWGPLPPTWVSSSRPAPSGVRFYRAPTGLKFKTPGPHIDILQRHHRYLCAWPSTHPDTGDPYRWITPDGEPADGPPRLEQLPELPAAWVAGMNAETMFSNPGPIAQRARVQQSAAVARSLSNTLADLYANRHDNTVAGVCALVRLESDDHPGASEGIDSLRVAFLNSVTADGSRKVPEAEREWDRMLKGAYAKVASTPSTRPKWGELVGPDAAMVTPSPTGAWDDPEPLEVPIGYGPEFPVDILPDWVQEQIHAVAKSFQVPTDLPAMLALGALSVATMGRIRVKLTGSKWNEQTNLYLVCAMPPGAGKSPVFKSMVRCLTRLQEDLTARSASTIREAEAKKELLERKAKAAMDKAAKLESSQVDMDLAIDLKAKAEACEVPPKPRLLAEDTTPEALVSLMGEHGGRMALLSSEGGIFDMMAGQYADRGKTANLAVYLQGWSGDTITQDRIGRAAIRIEEALLTICVTTQPSVLARLGENPDLAGRGLPVRFMFAVPPSNVGRRDRWAVLQDVADTVQSAYDSHVYELGLGLAKYARPVDLHLTVEARNLFLDWDQAIEHRQDVGGDLAGLAEWVSKLRATVLRVAGLLHLAEGAEIGDEIGTATMARALTIADYWLAHSLVVHATWSASSDPRIGRARGIVEWAVRERRESFTARELHQANRSQFDKVEEVVEPLEYLASAGWLRAESGIPIRVGQRGTPSPRFTVHPEAEALLLMGLNLPVKDTESHKLSAMRVESYRGFQKNLPTSEIPQEKPTPHPSTTHGTQLVTFNPEAPMTTDRDDPPPVPDPDEDEDLDRVWFDDDDNPINPEETP